jgi:hypothetical protein
MAAYAAPPLGEVLGVAGFDREQIQAIRAGELVSVEGDGTSERELEVKLAFLVRAPIHQLQALFLASRDYEYDPSVIAFARIRGNGSRADFRRLRLEPDSEAMTRAFLNARPGFELNLSSSEMAAFNALNDRGNARERVEAQLREMLLARYRDYRSKGVDGIGHYSRSRSRHFMPGAGLWRKTGLDSQLEKHAPSFHRVLLQYPKSKPQGLDETFSWVNFRIDGKPTIALVHRMGLLDGDVYVFAKRHFYVSRTHNSVQITGGAFPVEEGTVLLYVNRTSTDRVAGFGMATRRELEQRVLAGEISQMFERLRAGEAETN